MSEKERIAILGGGMGALTAALGLTSTPGWQERPDEMVLRAPYVAAEMDFIMQAGREVFRG